jgi:hypothetical protein
VNTERKKKFGVELPEALIEEWGRFCQQKGIASYRGLMGALRLFMALPAGAREILMGTTDQASEEAAAMIANARGVSEATDLDLIGEISRRISALAVRAQGFETTARLRGQTLRSRGPDVVEVRGDERYYKQLTEILAEERKWTILLGEVIGHIPDIDRLPGMKVLKRSEEAGRAGPRIAIDMVPKQDADKRTAASTSEAVAQVEADLSGAKKASEHQGQPKAAGKRKRSV